MQYTTEWRNRQRQWGVVIHTIAVLGLVILAAVGIRVEGVGGWIACPPQLIKLAGGQRRGQRERCHAGGFAWRAGWVWLRRSWMVAVARSEALMVLVSLTEHREWGWVCLLPWVTWLWKGLGVAWPGLGQQPLYRVLGRVWEEASRVALMGLALVWLGRQLSTLGEEGMQGLAVGGVSVPRIEVEQDEEEVYHVRLRGEFEVHVDGQVEFYKRMLIIFLGHLEVAGESRSSRRTRDGRTPFVRQEQLAMWFGVPQPHISRWFKYWLERDWQRMLSRKWGEILTAEVRQRVIDSWVTLPWYSAQRMWEHLRSQGSRITLRQVKQVGRESGWTLLRQRLRKVYRISADSFRHLS